MTARIGLARWHSVLEAGSKPADLAAMIHEEAVFHSPVVHTPQVGKAIVTAYLAAAGEVLGGENFRYLREIVDEDQAVLEFATEIGGIHVNGVDIIIFDEAGMITDFKVMVRPLKAINAVWEAMAAQLGANSKPG